MTLLLLISSLQHGWMSKLSPLIYGQPEMSIYFCVLFLNLALTLAI